MDERRDRPEPQPEPDSAADTQAFRAFVNRDEPPVQRTWPSFRVLTLLAGLAVVAVVVWLLLR